MDIVKASVRAVVELILRNGDIDSSGGVIADRNAAVLGSKAHRKIQKAKFEGYKSEVALNCEFEFEDYGFAINFGGRADGIFTDDTGTVCIDEIKSTLTPLEFIDGEDMLHWGQAMCYAYMYSVKKPDENSENWEYIKNINTQITYYNLETEEMKVYKRSFDFDALEIFINDLVGKYALWVKMERDWRIVRNASIDELKFPFERYRKGQRELAAAAYRTIIAEKKLFVNAPTGIGKTISTIFPAIKSMTHSNLDKIFYLTAKTITRAVAFDAIYLMQKQGLQFKTITITAKDKICFCNADGERICAPDFCEYAKGHYDRVNDAIMDTFKDNNAMTRDVIEEYAQKHKVCPYELSLDLSSYTDAVICDYNYVFDPVIYLKRFFQNNFDRNYVFLIDEAHNLVDRAREMYSAEIKKSPFSALKKNIYRKYKLLKKSMTDINKYMSEYKKRCNAREDGKNYIVLKEYDKEFAELLLTFTKECEIYLKEMREMRVGADSISARAPVEGENGFRPYETPVEDSDNLKLYAEMLQLYFAVIMYQVISDLYDERYVMYISAEDSELTVKLFCLDPSFLIGEAMKRAKSSVIFSATLSPLPYYKEILSGADDDNLQSLLSPFNKNNLCLIVGANINTKYKEREKSYEQIAEYIYITAQNKGNYLVFFPSYEYMKNVYGIFCEKYPETPSIIQTGGMKEEERDIFLNSFQAEEPDNHGKKNKTLVGFCVLGGVFSEGIDLTGDRLTGAIIIGVGLPKLSAERDIIKRYFDEKNNLGYEYSYMYPGMNKVLQAAGRVIRTETDRGIVVLLDERFNYNYYKQLFPEHWSHFKVVRNPSQMKKIIDLFGK
ncbi:MAG: ATP-dependent DNA helicase [Oscillospiraceae bacterium]|nr:ATP-dependent DNA helicase [Oscillospiraceae bacterium]